jgi:hypothetical protein
VSREFLATPGTGTWTVPAGVTSATIRLLSGGGTGVVALGGSITGGDGGGAGAYAEYADIALTPGAVINFRVGTGGGTRGTSGSPGTADSWFSSSGTYYAQGGSSFSPTLGGQESAGTPTVFHQGGAGGQGTGSWVASGGGGGAGGPHGIGADGGSIQLFPFAGGGGGGGGADGGAGGQNSNYGFGPGGAGGANRLGSGGGAGGTSSIIPGAAGTAGGGGGGGWGNGAADKSVGGAGSFETLWGTYGPGSGGGGAGYSADTANNGGNGGGRGGGGGGASPGGTAGVGQDGLIVIEYRGSGSSDGRGRVYSRYVKSRSSAPRPPPAPPPTAPVNTGAPAVNQARVGVVSTCSPGTWTGTAPITFSYQWKVDGSNVGTDATTYTPLIGDVGKSLTCTVTANNITGIPAVATSGGVTITNTVGPSIDIADADALWAAMQAWPTTGNKTWRLTGTDYGQIGAYVWGFDSAPVIIDGLGAARIEWIWFAETSGLTLQNCTVYGFHPSSGCAVTCIPDAGHESDLVNLTFNNVVLDSGEPLGTQSGGGFFFRNMANANITINGQGVASLSDVQGRTVAAVIVDCYGSGSIAVNNLTISNNGQDGMIISGSKNITINANLLKDFYWEPGAHPDAIQFFGSSGNNCENITVTNNGIDQGSAGQSMQGIFMENVINATIQNNWIYAGTFNNAISMSAGGPALIDNNFAQGLSSPGGGGVIISRGATINNTVTNNTACAVANYTADGTNPGYVPATLPGTNTLIAAASSYGDFTAFNAWKATHPTARDRT